MSPTIVKSGGFRLFFFSREEIRMYVHVNHSDGEAKFWLEPTIELAQNFGLSAKQLREARDLIQTNEYIIRAAWQRHFGN